MKKNNGNFAKNIWLGKQPEKVYAALLTEIRTGQLRPGVRVPTAKRVVPAFSCLPQYGAARAWAADGGTMAGS